MNDNTSCLVVESIMSSMIGNGKSSFGQPLLRYQKFMQIRSCLFYFLTSIEFVMHV